MQAAVCVEHVHRCSQLLCRQLYVLDTYTDAHNWRMNHALAVFLTCAAAALVCTATATVARLGGCALRIIRACLRTSALEAFNAALAVRFPLVLCFPFLIPCLALQFPILLGSSLSCCAVRSLALIPSFEPSLALRFPLLLCLPLLSPLLLCSSRCCCTARSVSKSVCGTAMRPRSLKH